MSDPALVCVECGNDEGTQTVCLDCLTRIEEA